MLAGFLSATGVAATSDAQNTLVDDTTGTVYRERHTMSNQEVVSTRTVDRQKTVYTPRTVVESHPTTRTTFHAVTTGAWRPYMANRWNPFLAPSIAYRYDTQTTWEPRSEVVHYTTTRNTYVAETHTVPTIETTRRIVQVPQTKLEPIGRVSAAGQDLRSRLRPLASHERVEGFGSASAEIASRPLGSTPRVAGDRSIGQEGHRPTTLMPSIYR